MPKPDWKRPFEFHLSRQVRDRYRFDRDLYVTSAEDLRPDVSSVHDLAYHVNRPGETSGSGFKPGHLYALAFIQQILHWVICAYHRDRVPFALQKVEDHVRRDLMEGGLDSLLTAIGEHFVPLAVYKGGESLAEFMANEERGATGRQQLIEQTLLAYLANNNSAARPLRDLFDDRRLPTRELYTRSIDSVRAFFATQPTFGPFHQSLYDVLAAPALASPDSLLGQLEYMRQHWADILGPELLRALLTAEDIVREDEKAPWRPPADQTPDLDYLRRLASRAALAGLDAESERFSHDTDWMPRVVLIAKSVYVWLDQLSRKYRRGIHQLDQIPDEELDQLARWGFTGLWLIGLWERSEASRRIKHYRGNVDAAASAYSLYDYRISGDLGGDAALENLRARALARGIRLASDLVPNHMGIDSVWVREHPQWFVQMERPPYAAYRFEGADLSGDPRVEIKIDDGYWSHTDAAVVFRRIDKWTGDTRYIYHGNDGTSMPWNDTAQLNFLLPEVREAMIQLILRVARQFPIIRFDAAMTLTKRHYQRLWFPEPGSGGAIPSRALFGMTKEEFDQHVPSEFWRDVVDRVAAEAPDTLLLAEAFWLLEGYFVRTLGMHRVYNSAFMNMLKLEENAKYRSVIKNVLEFDPRVLQRFVNFMNNPDEDTAIAQFGTGDKYFGVSAMMATMPGLPMFGHGQIEGFTEKYGHEFRRAYHAESIDDELVRRHEREIFPLLRQRDLFSGADQFLLYDVYGNSGAVDEDVFAFSNRVGDARGLIVYHNRYAETDGWIHLSAAFSESDGSGGRRLVRKSLAEGLGLRRDAGLFYVLRDRIAGLEYLRRAEDLFHHGLHVQLRAYQCQVFTEFREHCDDAEGRWAWLAETLGGRGVPSVEREFKRAHLAPLIAAFAEFASADGFRELVEEQGPAAAVAVDSAASLRRRAETFARKAAPFLAQATPFGLAAGDDKAAVDELADLALAVLRLPEWPSRVRIESVDALRKAQELVGPVIGQRRSLDERFWRVMCGWLVLRILDLRGGAREAAHRSVHRLDDWLLAETLAGVYQQLGTSEDEASHDVAIVRVLLAHHGIAATFSGLRKLAGVIHMLQDPAVRNAIGCHQHGGIEWLHRESFEELNRWLAVMTILGASQHEASDDRESGWLSEAMDTFRQIEDLAALAEYQMERFRTMLGYIAKRASAPE